MYGFLFAEYGNDRDDSEGWPIAKDMLEPEDGSRRRRSASSTDRPIL